jgi:hypothetical protein
MSNFRQPCLDCGRVTRNGSRCPEHQQSRDRYVDMAKAARKRATGQYAGDYRKRAQAVRETANICWLCGGGARPNGVLGGHRFGQSVSFVEHLFEGAAFDNGLVNKGRRSLTRVFPALTVCVIRARRGTERK